MSLSINSYNSPRPLLSRVITEAGPAPQEANDAVIDESLRKMMKSIQIEIPKDQPTPVTGIMFRARYPNRYIGTIWNRHL